MYNIRIYTHIYICIYTDKSKLSSVRYIYHTACLSHYTHTDCQYHISVMPLLHSLIQALVSSAVHSYSDCTDISSAALNLYTYGYPLVLMQATANVTNVHNTLQRYLTITPEDTLVVKPNVDTSYVQGFFDVSIGSYLINLPDHGTRYWLGEVLNGYSDTIGDPGSRTINGSSSILLLGPYGTTDNIHITDTTHIIKSNTNLVWLLGRIYQNGTAADQAIVRDLATNWTVTTYPYGTGNQPSSVNVTGPFYPSVPNATGVLPTVDAVAEYNPQFYYNMLSTLQCMNPPQFNDTPFIANMSESIGYVPCGSAALGSTFVNATNIDQCLPANFSTTATDHLKSLAIALSETPGNVVNGWTYVTDIGTYGTNYNLRAVIALIGLGANLPIDAVYLSTIRPMNGTVPYTITFNADELPPVQAFWSVTYYNAQSYLSANSINRYAVRSADPLVYHSNGSLTIYVQPNAPTNTTLQPNWLPSQSPSFILTLRLYNPLPQVINKTWIPPIITQQQAAA